MILYHLYKLKNVKNSEGGVLLLVKLPAEVCNFTKSEIPPWMFFTFQMVPKREKHPVYFFFHHQLTTPFPNLFAVTVSHMKTKPCLVNYK